MGLLLLASTVKYTEHANEERVLALAKLNAVTYANQMKDQLEQAVAITESLEQIIISENGRLDQFETIAKKQMNSYIHSIQLAPGGIVNQVYPSAGNDWTKLDLMTGGLSTKICQYGIDNDTVTFQGPTALPQGDQGIAVRNPVFLENSTGEKVFWGFTIALIRVPDIFRDTIDTLTNFGYYHRLSVATLPVSESYTPVNSSGVAFTESVSCTVELGNCCWKLEVAPIAGWNADSARNAVLVGGLVIVLLLTALLVVGIRFAGKTYTESMRLSEAQELCSTLTSVISDKLRFCGTVTQDENGGLTQIFIQNVGSVEGKGDAFQIGEDGQLALGDGHLLGSASYPKGLQVTAFTLRYDASTDIFSVTLEIGDRSRQTLSQTSFEVKRINRTVT